MTKIIEYCTYYADKKCPEISKPLSTGDLSTLFPEWDV
eukprot:CAMPEP_0201281626 /NCGR_PEP_ID=MMETSP1317-20130820/3543_1 /ASSEMBLY_ACC=CAM_ASM_000770 /TAXON_ID=187299 /ORGANISM="Undescribed Undescribed, Strain Undescribed" /LENGTH=37 /DNA_ID= /DNA_START= /DNA_END= /DNA_ORIENTATION=